MTTIPQEVEPGQALALAEERTAPSPGTVATEVAVVRDPTAIEEKAEERDQAVAVVAV